MNPYPRPRIKRMKKIEIFIIARNEKGNDFVYDLHCHIQIIYLQQQIVIPYLY